MLNGLQPEDDPHQAYTPDPVRYHASQDSAGCIEDGQQDYKIKAALPGNLDIGDFGGVRDDHEAGRRRKAEHDPQPVEAECPEDILEAFYPRPERLPAF